jgi:hypothetical protein
VFTNGYYASAALLLIIIGVAHSALGEWLIFRRMVGRGFIPITSSITLGAPYIRILWATWHLASLLGWGLSATLLWLAWQAPSPAGLPIAALLAVTLLASAALVGVATRGRHLGWVALLMVALLILGGMVN